LLCVTSFAESCQDLSLLWRTISQTLLFFPKRSRETILIIAGKSKWKPYACSISDRLSSSLSSLSLPLLLPPSPHPRRHPPACSSPPPPPPLSSTLFFSFLPVFWQYTFIDSREHCRSPCNTQWPLRETNRRRQITPMKTRPVPLRDECASSMTAWLESRSG